MRYVGHIIRRSQFKTEETRKLISLNMSKQQEITKGGTVERETRGKRARKLMVCRRLCAWNSENYQEHLLHWLPKVSLTLHMDSRCTQPYFELEKSHPVQYCMKTVHLFSKFYQLKYDMIGAVIMLLFLLLFLPFWLQHEVETHFGSYLSTCVLSYKLFWSGIIES